MLSSNQNNHTIISDRYLVPSITLVLNFDKREWKNNLQLTDLFDKDTETWEKLAPFVNDYKVNVLNVSCLSEEELRKFSSRFKIVADFLSNYMKGKPNIFGNEDIGTEQEYKEIMEILEIITSDKTFSVLKNSYKKGCTMEQTLAPLSLKMKTEGISEYQEKLKKLKNLLIKTGKLDLLVDLVDDPDKIDEYLEQNSKDSNI